MTIGQSEPAAGVPRRPPRRMKFTDRGIRALRPPPSGMLEASDVDLPGFGVRVMPTGLRTWVVRYRHCGRVRRLKLGNLPPLGLAEARALAQKALSQAALGQDPAQAKTEARGAPTFGLLAAEYLAKHAPKKRTGEGDRAMLEREVLPVWRHLRAGNVRRSEVMALVDDIAEGRGKRRVPGRPAPIRANRVLALIRKVFNFGIQRGLVETNPCHLVARPASERRRERVLTEEEIRGLWDGLDARAMVPGRERERAVLAGAVRLLLLTAQRRGEILSLRWQDVTEEGGAWWWTIPGSVSKNGRAHRVPLSPQAVAILDSLRSFAGSWVFPGRIAGEHLHNIELAIDRARAKHGLAPFTPHDLRRTAASLMTGLGIPRLTVKKILNHADPDVTAIYDRHSYDAEKRVALDAWGRRVESIVGEKPRADG